MNRGNLNIKIVILYFILLFKCYAENSTINQTQVVLGSDDAIVKIKIFSSFTCPHCANFHFNVIPEIKKEFVDSGKVQLIFIDYPLDQAAFNASKLLHCTEKNKQMDFIDLIYENQSEWTSSSSIDAINKNLKNIVKNLGITSLQFDKCLIDTAISDKILNGRIEASKSYSINSTPTIVINGKKLEGSVNFKNIKKKIEKLI